MKKILTILLLSFLFVGCIEQEIEEKENLKEYHLEDVNFLLITNPTRRDKDESTTWVKIQDDSRAIVNTEANLSEVENFPLYVEHTLPAKIIDPTLLKKKNARSVNDEVEFVSFKEGDLHTFYDYNNSEINAELQYEGEYCYVWQDLDEETSKLTLEELKMFADNFDSIYIKQTALCGPKYDGNGMFSNIIKPNEKISILMTDIFNGDANNDEIEDEKGSIVGFFNPNNYIFPVGEMQPFKTSKIEVIVIDSVYAKDENSKDAVSLTSVHEFNHLLNFVNKYLKKEKNYETWYTEMLAMVAEDFFMEELDVGFEGSPHERLIWFVNAWYNIGFRNWPSDVNKVPGEIVSSIYSNTYAFGAFLVRNYGGAKLFHEICTNNDVNEESVIQAIKTVTGKNKSFSDLLMEFGSVVLNTSSYDYSSYPSLYREYSGTVDNYEFKLEKIDLENLTGEPNEIGFYLPTEIENAYLGSYGFQIVYFEDPTDIVLKIKSVLEFDYLSLKDL